jgi:hypothetical protein
VTFLYPDNSSIRRKRVVNVRMTIRAKKGVSSIIKRKCFSLIGITTQSILATAVALLDA